MEISMFISRCLAYGVEILPFEQNQIIKASEKYKVPSDYLAKFDREEFNKYVKALSLASRGEESIYWSRGFDLLSELGFKEEEVVVGDRRFIKMVWKI